MNDPAALEPIFFAALERRTADGRAAYLAEACGGDIELRRRVERMLAAHDAAGAFLETPPPDLAATAVQPPPAVIVEGPGTVIGPYKLLLRIGEGGFGVVFLAEQERPVRRRVAVKVIKPGMDTREVVARFEAERQALALMDHPNIAKVLDGGSTASGRPYFVMELVDGVPVTEFCDERRLSVHERLELFVPVCMAVHHAHQKGVIHRDVKPSNVLVAVVDGAPVPKVIDFGVAKATDQRPADATAFTRHGAVVGTLEYMSPEQAELGPLGVDTRSDIYSLGVLLYELLTGGTPLGRRRLREAAFGEILRVIREEEPPRPSARLSEPSEASASISASRRTEPAKLARLVRGELDWIVMKTLEKDRDRRYESADGLAADVNRYLSDEAVQACPPSTAYRFRKFARRNRGPVAAGALVAAAVLLGLAGTTWGFVRARHRQTEAETARRGEADQRRQAVSNLYESLVREARALRLARTTGYRGRAWQRLREAAKLDTPKRDPGELRREAAASLGDFVGLEPTVLRDLGDGEILSVAIHPRGALLAVGFSSGMMSVRRLPDGAEIARWSAHPTAVVSVAFDPRGAGLASATAGGEIVLWEPAGDGERAYDRWDRKRTLEADPLTDGAAARPAKLITVAFTPDGKQLAASSRGGSAVRLWGTADGRPTATLEARDTLLGCLAFSSDGRLLAAGCGGDDDDVEHPVLVWDVATGQVVQEVSPRLGQVMDLAFSSDGELLACGCDAGMAAFETSTAQRRLYSLGGGITAVAFSPDGQRLAGGGQIGGTRLWDLAANREVATLAQPMTAGEDNPGWVYSLALSSDGETIASASKKTVVLWDTGGADERGALRKFAGGVPGVAFSPDGNLLASVSKDRSVTLWDPSTGRLVRSLDGCQGMVQAVGFSPDGRTVAAGDWSGRDSIRIWDVESGRSLAALDPRLGGVWSVAFSSDGRHFAAGGDRGWAIWKIETGPARVGSASEILLQDAVRRPAGSAVGSVCFTPDGGLLAWVQREDHAFRVWDLGAGAEHPARIPRLASRYMLSVRPGADVPGPAERDKRLWLDTRHGPEIWDMASGRRVGPATWPPELEALPGELKWGWCTDLSPDRTKWAVGRGDGTLDLWDLTKVRARLEEAGFGWEAVPPKAEGRTARAAEDTTSLDRRPFLTRKVGL